MFSLMVLTIEPLADLPGGGLLPGRQSTGHFRALT